MSYQLCYVALYASLSQLSTALSADKRVVKRCNVLDRLQEEREGEREFCSERETRRLCSSVSIRCADEYNYRQISRYTVPRAVQSQGGAPRSNKSALVNSGNIAEGRKIVVAMPCSLPVLRGRHHASWCCGRHAEGRTRKGCTLHTQCILARSTRRTNRRTNKFTGQVVAAGQASLMMSLLSEWQDNGLLPLHEITNRCAWCSRLMLPLDKDNKKLIQRGFQIISKTLKHKSKLHYTCSSVRVVQTVARLWMNSFCVRIGLSFTQINLMFFTCTSLSNSVWILWINYLIVVWHWVSKQLSKVDLFCIKRNFQLEKIRWVMRHKTS